MTNLPESPPSAATSIRPSIRERRPRLFLRSGRGTVVWVGEDRIEVSRVDGQGETLAVFEGANVEVPEPTVPHILAAFRTVLGTLSASERRVVYVVLQPALAPDNLRQLPPISGKALRTLLAVKEDAQSPSDLGSIVVGRSYSDGGEGVAVRVARAPDGLVDGLAQIAYLARAHLRGVLTRPIGGLHHWMSLEHQADRSPSWILVEAEHSRVRITFVEEKGGSYSRTLGTGLESDPSALVTRIATEVQRTSIFVKGRFRWPAPSHIALLTSDPAAAPSLPAALESRFELPVRTLRVRCRFAADLGSPLDRLDAAAIVAGRNPGLLSAISFESEWKRRHRLQWTIVPPVLLAFGIATWWTFAAESRLRDQRGQLNEQLELLRAGLTGSADPRPLLEAHRAERDHVEHLMSSFRESVSNVAALSTLRAVLERMPTDVLLDRAATLGPEIESGSTSDGDRLRWVLEGRGLFPLATAHARAAALAAELGRCAGVAAVEDRSGEFDPFQAKDGVVLYPLRFHLTMKDDAR